MPPEFAPKIEKWPTEKLIPHARNARTHSEAQVAQIAGSIAEFGFVNPILVGDDGVLVGGHGRVLAARKLGLKEVPVIVLKHLTPTQRRALMLADNKLAMNAGWDDELLGAELSALQEEGVDLELIGWTEDEIDALIADNDADKEVEEVSKWETGVASISYTLVFDTLEQQETWYQFLRAVKGKYGPEVDSIGVRLELFLNATREMWSEQEQ